MTRTFAMLVHVSVLLLLTTQCLASSTSPHSPTTQTPFEFGPMPVFLSNRWDEDLGSNFYYLEEPTIPKKSEFHLSKSEVFVTKNTNPHKFYVTRTPSNRWKIYQTASSFDVYICKGTPTPHDQFSLTWCIYPAKALELDGDIEYHKYLTVPSGETSDGFWGLALRGGYGCELGAARVKSWMSLLSHERAKLFGRQNRIDLTKGFQSQAKLDQSVISSRASTRRSSDSSEDFSVTPGSPDSSAESFEAKSFASGEHDEIEGDAGPIGGPGGRHGRLAGQQIGTRPVGISSENARITRPAGGRAHGIFEIKPINQRQDELQGVVGTGGRRPVALSSPNIDTMVAGTSDSNPIGRRHDEVGTGRQPPPVSSSRTAIEQRVGGPGRPQGLFEGRLSSEGSGGLHSVSSADTVVEGPVTGPGRAHGTFMINPSGWQNDEGTRPAGVASLRLASEGTTEAQPGIGDRLGGARANLATDPAHTPVSGRQHGNLKGTIEARGPVRRNGR